MGAYKRYREFGGKEQREEPRVREFREFGTARYYCILICNILGTRIYFVKAIQVLNFSIKNYRIGLNSNPGVLFFKMV